MKKTILFLSLLSLFLLGGCAKNPAQVSSSAASSVPQQETPPQNLPPLEKEGDVLVAFENQSDKIFYYLAPSSDFGQAEEIELAPGKTTYFVAEIIPYFEAPLWFQYDEQGSRENFRVAFYPEDAAFHAAITDTKKLNLTMHSLQQGAVAESDGVNVSYHYHSVLREWAKIEPVGEILFFAQNENEARAYQNATESGQTYQYRWQAYYPETATEDLLNPMEDHGFLVPEEEIYNVTVWHVDSFRDEQFIHLDPLYTWQTITNQQIIALQTYGDFGMKLVSYQLEDRQDAKWFFLLCGYDGMGGYHGMYYHITDTVPLENLAPVQYPW